MSPCAPLWRLSRSAQRLIGGLCLLVFLLISLLYFIQFSLDLDRYLFTDGYFRLALNSHDHGVYVATIDSIAQAGLQYGLNNDFGISTIYLGLLQVFPWLKNPNLTLIAFVFNALVMCASFVLWVRICDYYQLGMTGQLAFFVNTSMIYFLQLINKDMLTVFGFLLAIDCGIRRRTALLLLLLPLLFLVRQQLAVFAVLFIYFMGTPQPQRRMLLAYVLSSLSAGLLSVFASVIGEDSAGDGFSAYLLQFNANYYVGYLIFNPLRVLQYLVDAYASFSFFLPEGGVDVAKLLRLPMLIMLMMLGRQLWTLVSRFHFWLDTPLKPLVVAVVAYLVAWLMNPTVNARYVVLIMPVLLLFGLTVRKISILSNKQQCAI